MASTTRKISTKPDWQKKIAKERISILFEQANLSFRENPAYSRRYVELARRIGMRYNISIPTELKRKFCKKCYSYLVPGVSSTHRANKKQQAVIITCKNCGNVMRFPYRKEKAK